MSRYSKYSNSMEGISNLISDERSKDITINCVNSVNNVKFKAHKVILIGTSPVFRAMFSGKFNEKDEVTITDIEPEIIEKLIRGMYMKLVNFENVEEAAQFYNAAEKYNILDLKRVAIDYLEKHCRFDNCYFLLEHAIQYNLSGLKSVCLRVFRDRPYLVMNSLLNSVDTLSDDVVAIFFALFCSFLSCEFDLYQTLETFVDIGLMSNYKQTLSKIRVLTMTATEVFSLKLLTSNEKCTVIGHIKADKNNVKPITPMPNYLSSDIMIRLGIEKQSYNKDDRMQFLMSLVFRYPDFQTLVYRMPFFKLCSQEIDIIKGLIKQHVIKEKDQNIKAMLLVFDSILDNVETTV